MKEKSTIVMTQKTQNEITDLKNLLPQKVVDPMPTVLQNTEHTSDLIIHSD